MTSIKKIGAVIFNSKSQILAVKPNWTDIYLLPGGKIKTNEIPESCLERELKEELGIVKIIKCSFYKSYNVGKALFDDANLVIDAYVTNIQGKPIPSSEIEKLTWISKKDCKEQKIKLASVFPLLFSDLEKSKYIK